MNDVPGDHARDGCHHTGRADGLGPAVELDGSGAHAVADFVGDVQSTVGGGIALRGGR